MDRLDIVYILNKHIVNNNDFSNIIREIEQNIFMLQSGVSLYGSDRYETIESLNSKLENYKIRQEKFWKFKTEFNKYFIEFNSLMREYSLMKMFSKSLGLGNFKPEVESRNEKDKLQSKVTRIISKIHDLIYENRNLIIHSEESNFEFLNQIFSENGYNLHEISHLAYQEFDKIESEPVLVGVDKEKYNLIQEMNERIENQQIDEIFKPCYFSDPYIPETDEIHKEIRQNLINIQALRMQHQLNISDENYKMIVETYKEIVKLHQKIQIYKLTKEAFKNTEATKYYKMIDKEIEDMLKTIYRLYNKINKITEQLGIDSELKSVQFENYHLKDLENKTEQKQNAENPQIPQQQISETKEKETNQEKQNKPSEIDLIIEKLLGITEDYSPISARYYQEYMIYKMKNGASNINFLGYLKSQNNSDISGLINYEELKEKLIAYIYDEFVEKFKGNINDKDLFISYCSRRSDIITKLGGMDSVIGEADLEEFFDKVNVNSNTEEKERTM